jgi:hypothetical protein
MLGKPNKCQGTASAVLAGFFITGFSRWGFTFTKAKQPCSYILVSGEDYGYFIRLVIAKAVTVVRIHQLNRSRWFPDLYISVGGG